MFTATATARFYSKVYWATEQEKREAEIRAINHGYEKPSGEPDMSRYLRTMAKYGILRKILDNVLDDFVEQLNKKINMVMRIRENR